MESQPSLVYLFQAGQAPPSYIKAKQGIPPQGMGSKKPVHVPGVNSDLIVSEPTNFPRHRNVTHIKRD